MSPPGERNGVLSLEAFYQHIARELALPPEPCLTSAPLKEELGFDSLSYFELWSVLAELGVVLPDETLASLATVEDVYFHYVQAVG